MAAAPEHTPREEAPPIGGWRMLSAPVDARLAGLVSETTWYEERAPGVRRREHLPAPAITLILNLADPFWTRVPGEEACVFGAGQGFLAGATLTPAESAMVGENRGVEIGLTPLGAHQLLGGLPLHELGGRTVALDDLLGCDARALAEPMLDDPDPARQLAHVSAFLLQRLGNTPAEGPFAWAWERLAGAHGDLRIRQLARELGWSEKRLTRAFRAHFGLSPKATARLMRFARTVELAQQGPPRWAELALQCGYTDQAHLAKEIRAFSGSTPAGLLARLLPQTLEGPATD